MRSSRKLFLSLALLLLLMPGKSFCQAYRFSNFRTENGLPGTNVVYTLGQDKNGFLWVGTTDGLSRFDGIAFYPVPLPDTTVSGNPSASLTDRSGTLWFGFSSGAVCYADGGMLRTVLPDDSSSVSEIAQAPDGYIYAFHQQNRTVVKIDAERKNQAGRLTRGDDDVSSATFTGDGKLLIGTQGKILRCSISDNRIVTDVTFDSFDYARIIAIQPLPGGKFLAGTEGNGLFIMDGASPESASYRITGQPELEAISARDIYTDSGGACWVATRNDGLFKIVFNENHDAVAELKHFTTASGLAGENINTVFRDLENNIWIGHNGQGLSKLPTEAFTFYSPGGQGRDNIISIAAYNDSYLLGTPSGYYLLDPSSGEPGTFYPLPGLAGRNAISAYNVDSRGNMLLGTRGGGLYIKRGQGAPALFYRSGESGKDNINDIAADERNIWIASVNGVSILDASSGVLKEHYSMDRGLPFNNTSKLFLSGSGSAWVATQSMTFDRIEPGKGVISSGVGMGAPRRNKLLAVSEDAGGTVWVGTEGYGLYAMAGDSVISITTAEGLFSDKVNSILPDSHGAVWLGHDRGISIYDRNSGAARSLSTDFAGEGQCNPDAMIETPDGRVLIGTTSGLIVYDRQADITRNLPPAGSIVSITIDDSTYNYAPSIRLPYKKRYQVTVKYTGLKLSSPESVFYSTYMENYDDDWSEFTTDREKTYSLSDGRYTFSFISVTQDGLEQVAPLEIAISIRPPLWRRWWFIMLLLTLGTMLVVHLIRIRERAAKLREKELEKKVEERTIEVEEQKREIERQNIEITDSINYAKRIQSSVLPDVARLKEVFADAFILFHPRDIVSGDFYWFDKAEDGTVVVVCADSTGHGVPGAFMSMIGSSFLQDIVKRQKIT
nr:hypothetical protein [Bacteroidales bacterium]